MMVGRKWLLLGYPGPMDGIEFWPQVSIIFFGSRVIVSELICICCFSILLDLF